MELTQGEYFKSPAHHQEVVKAGLELFRKVRGMEPPADVLVFDRGLLDFQCSIQDGSVWETAPKGLDAFCVHAGILAVGAGLAQSGVKSEPFQALRVDLRMGLAAYDPVGEHLRSLHRSLLEFAIDPASAAWADVGFWLWGPPAKSGRFLFGAASVMGRGRVKRALLGAGWSRHSMRWLVAQWLDAGRVHASAREPFLAMFEDPPAPIVGRTQAEPPTSAMVQLAFTLIPNDPELAKDLSRVLAWLAARAQGGTKVYVPTAAIQRGRARHPDAVGITARVGERLWPLVRDTVLERIKGCRVGKKAAEYQIREEFRAVLLAN